MEWPALGTGGKVSPDGVAAAGINTATPSGTNTKGAWTQIIASTSFEASALYVMASPGQNNVNTLVDIGIGAASSEQVILADFLVGSAIRMKKGIVLPIAIPSGSRIAARSATSNGGAGATVAVALMAGGLLLPRASAKIITVGADSADSGGTGIDSGGSANTYPGWTELTSSLAASTYGVAAVLETNQNTSPTAYGGQLQIGAGAAGSEIVVAEIPFDNGFNGDHITPNPTPWLPLALAAGTRLAVRHRSSAIGDLADRVIDVVLHCLT